MDDNGVICEFPRLLQIGSTGRNSGKTVIAKQLVTKYKAEHSIVALKIITISGERGVCQRGGTGCGICTSIDSGFELIEETNRSGKKDTMELLNSGCDRVFLLKVFKGFLLAGFEAFIAKIPTDSIIICESNSLRNVVRPGLFVMIDNHRKNIKPSAAEVYDLADVVLSGAEDEQLKQIYLVQETSFCWKVRTAQEVF